MGLPELVADGDYDPVAEANGPRAIFSFAAVFAEIRVDPDLGLVRMSRFVGAYDAARIINPRTARSQAHRWYHLGNRPGAARAVGNRSADGPVPQPATTPATWFRLTPTFRDSMCCLSATSTEDASPLGAKGLGELTAVVGGPRNRQCGLSRDPRKCVRDLPITVEKLL